MVSVDFWTVQPGLSIGEITPSEQDIAYRQSPQILTYSSDDRPSIQSVQWQQKDVYTSDWINISGANSYTYSPRPLSQTTEFRVVARSKGADIEHTEPAIVRVSPQLVGGTVSGDQTIFPDGIPLPFTNSTAAFGGSSDITYQWQAKTEQGNWTDVPNAKGLSYDPPALTTTTNSVARPSPARKPHTRTWLPYRSESRSRSTFRSDRSQASSPRRIGYAYRGVKNIRKDRNIGGRYRRREIHRAGFLLRLSGANHPNRRDESSGRSQLLQYRI